MLTMAVEKVDVFEKLEKSVLALALRTIQLQIECGGSKEYQLRTGPSQEIIKDLARATSSPPAESTTAS